MPPMSSALRASFAVAFAWATLGCSRAEPGAGPDRTAAPSRSAEPAAQPPGAARGLQLVKAGGGEVSQLVRTERDKAAAEGRDLIVYVGAKWCDPCRRFHAAAERGELNDAFPRLTILELDLDEDRDRIHAAGYSSSMIPLFVKPGPDGRGTARRFEGGMKGDRAVPNITSRLRELIDK